MAFKRKSSGSQGEVFKFERVGDTITGVYGGSVPFTGDYGPTLKHIFKTEKGIKVVFGSRNLNELLENERAGQLMKVRFDSTKPSRKGNPLKLFTVDIDDEYQASEDEVNDFVNAASSEDDESIADLDEPEAGDDDEALDEIKTATAKRNPTAAAPTAAKKQTVAEMLANRKRAS